MTTSTTKRAAKGGEFGANGDWYEGGKFINTISENHKRHGSTPSKARKVEIAPYEWVYPVEGKQSIFGILGGIFGKVIDGRMVIRTSDQTLNHFGRTMSEVEELAAKWNAGERWA